MTLDSRARIVAKCCKCGYQMCESEVWVSNCMKDNKVFCFSHAPESAIRQKDLMKQTS